MGELPSRACLVANVIETQVMHNQGGPIVFSKLGGNMPRHILVHFHEVLRGESQSATFDSVSWRALLTETKKLVVPSDRSNIPGNSLSHVSSPYITSRSPRALSCASQVSWYARVDVVSDSAMFRITSRNEGTDPVVIAFSRGIVTVGEPAWAVKGSTAPARIRLLQVSTFSFFGEITRLTFEWTRTRTHLRRQSH